MEWIEKDDGWFDTYPGDWELSYNLDGRWSIHELTEEGLFHYKSGLEDTADKARIVVETIFNDWDVCVNCGARFIATENTVGYSADGMEAFYSTSEKECSVRDGGGNIQSCMTEPY